MMATVINKTYHKTYDKLIQAFPLRPIRSEEDNDAAAEICDSLVARKDLSQAELDYLEVLTEMIVKYENEAWMKDNIGLSPRDLIRSLMTENDLSQKDLIPFFGSQSRVSEFLSGERNLSVEQARRLAGRFKLKLESLLK